MQFLNEEKVSLSPNLKEPSFLQRSILETLLKIILANTFFGLCLLRPFIIFCRSVN